VTADPSSDAAASRAVALARITGARLVLLHVVAPDAAPVDWDALQQRLAARLGGVATQALLRHGPEGREILAVARETAADLIVMTPHRRWQEANSRLFSRFLLHSALCRVLLEADCPVWVEPERGTPRIDRVLCAVASLSRDRDTIPPAAEFAALLGARLTLFRGAIKADVALPGESRRAEEWQQDVVAAVRADLEKLRGTAAADIRVGVGSLAGALLKEAPGLAVVRRISREFGGDETAHPLLRADWGPVLSLPGEAPRPAVQPAQVNPRLRLVLGPALLLLMLLFGVWAVHAIYRMATVQGCGSAYQCAFKAGLIENVRTRPGARRPEAGPPPTSRPATGAGPE
jgi:nucleotide-binding universal stress UspA family protein